MRVILGIVSILLVFVSGGSMYLFLNILSYGTQKFYEPVRWMLITEIALVTICLSMGILGLLIVVRHKGR